MQKCQCYYTLSDQSIPLVAVKLVVSLLTEQLWINLKMTDFWKIFQFAAKPPTVHHFQGNSRFFVKPKEKIRLRCSFEGNPRPRITWFKAKLYIPSTLNTDYLMWHTQLIVCAVLNLDCYFVLDLSFYLKYKLFCQKPAHSYMPKGLYWAAFFKCL